MTTTLPDILDNNNTASQPQEWSLTTARSQNTVMIYRKITTAERSCVGSKKIPPLLTLKCTRRGFKNKCKLNQVWLARTSWQAVKRDLNFSYAGVAWTTLWCQAGPIKQYSTPLHYNTVQHYTIIQYTTTL